MIVRHLLPIILLLKFNTSADTYDPKNADGTFRITTDVTFKDSWKAMTVALEQGKTKAIGVSNFSIKT